jgi:hypothetical protein
MPVATPCPANEPTFIREPFTAAPACLSKKSSFRFTCTPDPERPGHCLETIGGLPVDASKALADELACLQRIREWEATEKELRGQ